MDSRERSRLEFYLSRIKANIADQTLPTLDETLAGYEGNSELLEKISNVTRLGPVERLYAAVLVSTVDREKADELLSDLKADKTSLSIQRPIGHSTVRIPLGLFARDFVENKSFHGEHLGHIEALDNWKIAISAEKRRTGKSAEVEALPRYDEVLDAKVDAERIPELQRRVAKLKNGSVAERFYAAALLDFVDEEAESRAILEDLKKETTEVSLLRGDTTLNFPANKIAAELLGEKPVDERPAAVRDPVARFFKWLGGGR